MEHTVYSEQEILKLFNSLQDGEADYEVIEGKFSTSKAGNPMVALKFKVWDKEGNSGQIRDWILLEPKWAHKFRSFWESCGHLELYKRGYSNDDDYPGKKGKCFIEYVEDGKYPGLKISKYLPYTDEPPKTYDHLYETKQQTVENITPMTDDDIPF